MSHEQLLTKIRLGLLELQIYNTKEKRENYLASLTRLAIEYKNVGDTESESFFNDFIEKQKLYFDANSIS